MAAVPPSKPAPWLKIIHFTFFGLPMGMGQLAGYTRSIGVSSGSKPLASRISPAGKSDSRLRLFLEIKLGGDLLLLSRKS